MTTVEAEIDLMVRQAFEVLSGWMVFKEEPTHTRLRRLCNQAFTPKSIAQLRDRATSLCKTLIDAIPVPGESDLIATVAAPLPSIIIAEMMGVPSEDRADFEQRTANFIANGVLALLRHPDQLAAVREDRVDMKTALEEIMRYDGPDKTVVRVAREDFEFAGQSIKAGQRVFLILSVANRDPLAFDEPERLRGQRQIDRRQRQQCAWRRGAGPARGVSHHDAHLKVALPN